jgi:hypothetical protein
MCEKIPYPSQQDAKEAAGKMFHHGKRRVMGHYFCNQCDAWHLTSHDKKKKLKKYFKLKYKNQFLNQ